MMTVATIDSELFDMSLDEGREALRLCNSFTRLPKIISLSGRIWINDWLTLLGEEWQSCDNISECADVLIYETDFSDLMDYPGDYRRFMMTDEEVAFFEALPEVVTIYRGCYANNKWGLSWSIDRAIAESFPNHHRYRQEGQPLIVTARVLKDDILAVKTDRAEAEIIAYRPKIVTTRHLPRES